MGGNTTQRARERVVDYLFGRERARGHRFAKRLVVAHDIGRLVAREGLRPPALLELVVVVIVGVGVVAMQLHVLHVYN